jgi:hypothetical protein
LVLLGTLFGNLLLARGLLTFERDSSKTGSFLADKYRTEIQRKDSLLPAVNRWDILREIVMWY